MAEVTIVQAIIVQAIASPQDGFSDVFGEKYRLQKERCKIRRMAPMPCCG
jgi:hypothetical protein